MTLNGKSAGTERVKMMLIVRVMGMLVMKGLSVRSLNG